MKLFLRFFLLSLGCWMLDVGCFSARAAGTNLTVTAVLTVTNNPTGTNGHYLVFQGATYRWTNLSSPTIGYISSTNSAAATATNLFARLSRDYTNTLRFSYAGAAKIQVSTFLNGSLTISNSAGWLTNLFTTNVITGGATPVSLTASNLTAVSSFTLGGVTYTSLSGLAGTNYNLSNTTAQVGVGSIGQTTNLNIGTNYSTILTLSSNTAVTIIAATNALIDARILDGTNKVAQAASAALLTGTNQLYAQTLTDNAASSNAILAISPTNASTPFNFTNPYTAYGNGTNPITGTSTDPTIHARVSVSNFVFLSGSYTNLRSGGTVKMGITHNGTNWVTTGVAASAGFTNATLFGNYVTNATLGVVITFVPTNYISTNTYAATIIRDQKIFVTDFGARGDGLKIYNASLTNATLTVTNGAFTSDMVGKRFAIYLNHTNADWRNSTVVAVNNSTNLTLAPDIYDVWVNYMDAWCGTDNTIPISNALASATGDFELFFPQGNYLCFGSALDANSGLYAVVNLPSDRSTGVLTNTSRTIVLRGATPPMIYPSFINAGSTTTLGTPNTGTILFNFAKPVSGYVNTFFQHDGTNAGGSQFGRERYLLQNLTLRQPGKPTHHAVFLKRSGTMYFKDFAIDVDQTTNWLNASSGEPPFYMDGIVSNANTVYGIYGPDPYNYAGLTLENVTVSYHGTDFRLGEHTVGIGKVTGVASGALLFMDGATGLVVSNNVQGTFNGSTFDFLFAYLCQYRIVISTNSTAREPLTIQNLSVEEGFPRADIGSMIYDPLKRGSITIQTISGTAQNTTIESTNGTWYNSINDSLYLDGVWISNSVITATSFTGSGAGLTGIPTIAGLTLVSNQTVAISNRMVTVDATKLSANSDTALGLKSKSIDGGGVGALDLYSGNTTAENLLTLHDVATNEVGKIDYAGVASLNLSGSTNINAAAITSGTVPSGRLPVTATNLAQLNGSVSGKATNTADNFQSGGSITITNANVTNLWPGGATYFYNPPVNGFVELGTNYANSSWWGFKTNGQLVLPDNVGITDTANNLNLNGIQLIKLQINNSTKGNVTATGLSILNSTTPATEALDVVGNGKFSGKIYAAGINSTISNGVALITVTSPWTNTYSKNYFAYCMGTAITCSKNGTTIFAGLSGGTIGVKSNEVLTVTGTGVTITIEPE